MNTSKTYYKNYAILICASVMVIALSSCFRLIKKVEPSENIVTREYDLKDFQGISIAKRTILYFSEGDHYSIKAQGPENMMDELRCSVSDDKVLKLGVHKGDRFNVHNDSERVNIWVTAPGVNSFTAMVDAVIKCDSLTQVRDLSVETYNASEFICPKVQTQNFSISSYNGAEVNIESCQADNLNATAYNAGSIKLSGKIENTMTLEAYNAASISFSGSATTVDAVAYNGADIQLEGEFQTKRVSQYNGAHISIGKLKIYLNDPAKDTNHDTNITVNLADFQEEEQDN